MGAWKYQIYFLCWTYENHVQHSLFINYVKYFNTDNGLQYLQNSNVLIILCFGGKGDWLGAPGGGYKTFHLLWGGVLNIFRRFLGGAKFYGRILENPPHPVHILYDRSLKLSSVLVT
jgi:hypothetical protein